MVTFNVWWNRYDRKFDCLIGYLEYDSKWIFYYDEEGVTVAESLGFTLFPEFPDIEHVYQSEKLFPTFDIRIRRNTGKITEEDKVDLLSKTEGILQTDNIRITKEETKVRQI